MKLNIELKVDVVMDEEQIEEWETISEEEKQENYIKLHGVLEEELSYIGEKLENLDIKFKMIK